MSLYLQSKTFKFSTVLSFGVIDTFFLYFVKAVNYFVSFQYK